MILAWHLIWKRWSNYRRRSLYLTFSLFLTFILLTVVSSASFNYSKQVYDLFDHYSGKIVIIQHGALFAGGMPLNSNINISLVDDLVDHPKIEGFTTVSLERMSSKIETDLLIGIDSHGDIPSNSYLYTCGVSLAEGEFPGQGSNEVAVGKKIQAVADDGKKTGDLFQIRNEEVKITGILKTDQVLQSHYILMSRGLFVNITGLSTNINMLLLELSPQVTEKEIENDLESLYPSLEVLTENERIELSAEVITGVEQFLLLIAAVSLIVGLLFIYALTNLTLASRFRELGTLKSLGHSPYSIIIELIIETFIASTAASLAGIAGTFVILSLWLTFTTSVLVIWTLVPLESLITSTVVLYSISFLGTLLGTRRVLTTPPGVLLRAVVE